ncbi:hypothetical protein MIZ03_0258 [Rhodoferax lithotrophicus]|uniref:histidine kinase n=2 Tax=Rhodoferax lithotrophicus TaxID=2798804 RepID=A0ABM7MGV7_9BURK|nr:hypothetical protein MIZ03_0258 [Rhodoferax sp. MIZ03]
MVFIDKTTRPKPVLPQLSEEGALDDAAMSGTNPEDLTPGAMRALIHELRMRQIELERQNDALRRTPGPALDLEVLNSINAEIVVLDQHGIIRQVNKPWQRFALENSAAPEIHTGIGSDYLKACRTDIHNPLSSATQAHDGIQKVITGELSSFTLEYPCHSTTRQRWFSMCALPLGKNPKDGITLTHTDITAHKQAQEDLLIAAAAFEIAQPIVILDMYGRVLRVNQAFTDITGYSDQVISGKTTILLFSKREPVSTYKNIWHDTSQTGVRRWQCWLRHQNGEDIFAQGTATAVKNKEGTITHYVSTFHDHTLVHQQEQQRVLHEAAHREALVREVHHRIKNNLQGIRGLLQRFGREKPEIAEQMHVVAGHLNGISIIHGLQGRHDQSLVRLCELTREIALATSVLWQTDIHITIPDNWVFRVVAEKEAVSMALVLNELLVNAIKHGGKARGHVSVSLQQGHGIEGVEVNILNAGFLRNNKNRPTGHHHGLQLIESLRPREGLTVTLTQRGDHVHTHLHITAPVITLDANS